MYLKNFLIILETMYSTITVLNLIFLNCFHLDKTLYFMQPLCKSLSSMFLKIIIFSIKLCFNFQTFNNQTLKVFIECKIFNKLMNEIDFINI